MMLARSTSSAVRLRYEDPPRRVEVPASIRRVLRSGDPPGALTISAPPATSQAVVGGDVVAHVSAEPLDGVFVTVVDDPGRRVAGVLT